MHYRQALAKTPVKTAGRLAGAMGGTLNCAGQNEDRCRYFLEAEKTFA